MPKENAPCMCLSIIMVDSVIKANKKYYSQKFLEEWKYVLEKIKIENHIDDDLEKVSQIVTLMMKKNMTLIMTNMTNNLLKLF